MSIRILVNGAFGRMGQIAVAMINHDDEFELVGQTGREYDLKKSIEDSKAHVVLDFTTASSVYQNTKTIIETGTRPVIGTSGLTPSQIKELQTECINRKLGGIIAPNFSIAAVLMMKYAQQIARYLPHVEIIEMHHDKKADSPSATALRGAELISAAFQNTVPLKKHHETLPGARGANYKGIAIHAIRLPGLLAHERIIFGNEGETLSLQHDTLDRQSFMPGVALALKKVMTLNHLVYGLEEIL